MEDNNNRDTVELATELTIAWLANPNTRAGADDVPAFLRTVHEAVSNLSDTPAPEGQPAGEPAGFTPAVSVRKSLASRDHIISMIDGKSYRSLKRHLSANGLTPEGYRERYGLKADYPMVAPGYSEARREVARKLGLGRKPGQRPGKSGEQSADTPEAEAQATQPKRPRRSAGAAKAAAQAHLGGDGETE